VRAGAWLWLVRRETAAEPGRAALIVASAGAAIAIAAFALGVAVYLHREVGPRISQLFPERRVIAKARSTDVAFVRLGTGRIPAAQVEAARAIPEAERVLVQRGATFPVSARFGIPGTDSVFGTDVILHGAPRDLIAPDLLVPGMAFALPAGPRQPVPVLLSAFFLDLYNLGLADSMGMPKLSPFAAIGREFELALGESSVGLAESRATPRTVTCRIVGLTPHPSLIGLVAPEEALLAWNAEFGPPAAAQDASALHIDARTAGDVPAVMERLAAMGLDAKAQSDVAERHRAALASARLGLALGALVTLLLAAVGVGATSMAAFRERQPVLALHRATGLSPRAALGLVAAQSAALAMLAALAGGAGAFGLSVAAERLRERYAGDLALVTADVTAFGAEEAIIAVVLAVAMVAVPPVIVAWRSVRRPVLAELGRRAL
jgi:hypothetical protein